MAEKKSKKRSRWWKLLWVVPVLFLIGIVSFFTVIIGGNNIGSDFCPEDFSRRSYYYLTVPFVGWQITPVSYTESSETMRDLLIKNRIFRPAAEPKSWHRIYDNRSRSAEMEYDARILTKILDEYDMEEYCYFWEKWTNDYPVHAKIFWPIVSRLGQEYLYIDLPELMSVARDPDLNTANFEMQIRAKAAEIFFRRAQQLQESGYHQRAVVLFDLAIEYGYDEVKATEMRTVSLEQSETDTKEKVEERKN